MARPDARESIVERRFGVATNCRCREHRRDRSGVLSLNAPPQLTISNRVTGGWSYMGQSAVRAKRAIDRARFVMGRPVAIRCS
jgi:hypothetical protein